MVWHNIRKVGKVTQNLNMEDDGSKNMGFHLSSDTVNILTRTKVSHSGFTMVARGKVKLQMLESSRAAGHKQIKLRRKRTKKRRD